MNPYKELANAIIVQAVKDYRDAVERLRYLCFKTWEQIAVQMGYGIDNIYKMHHKRVYALLAQDEQEYFRSC